MNTNSWNHFTKTLFITVTLIFLLGYTNTTVYGIEFSDYFPLDPAVHGYKTFQWTYGNTGTYSSYISGTLTVPYTSGDIVGTGIVNLTDVDMLYATNDGSEVKWLAFGIDTEFIYLSIDCDFTSHPVGWTLSTVTDDMLLDQGEWCELDRELIFCNCYNDQVLLFGIQNVTIPLGQYTDSVIIWYLDTKYPFKALDLSGKENDLGITLPDETQTGEYSVTGFDIYANGIGMIACGDIDAETGELVHLAELVDIDFPAPVVVLVNDLIQQVIDLDLHNSLKKKLLAKLNTALKKLQDGKESNDNTAVKPLTAFVDAVNDQSGNKISQEDADSLITAAQQIIDMLSSG